MATAASNPLALICGDDDFAVKQRARQLFQQWSAELGGMDHEIIEATAANSGDALKALARLREALNTLPFFGSGKVVWLRDCNFLGEERAASAAAVTETLAELAAELKKFAWQSVRLLISAGKVDKRKAF
ncbi:MAG: DNA polymerase III subunit delta, partial [Verrucomicrobiota bacterium]